MEHFTYILGHFKERPDFKPGDIIRKGEVIGIMGNTGSSTGDHLHSGCVYGLHESIFTLNDIESGKVKPSIRNLNYLIDRGLFKSKFKITTFYGCPDYMIRYKKVHHGYDLVPLRFFNKIPYVYWNRSKPGKVLKCGYHSGYGYYILIGFTN